MVLDELLGGLGIRRTRDDWSRVRARRPLQTGGRAVRPGRLVQFHRQIGYAGLAFVLVHVAISAKWESLTFVIAVTAPALVWFGMAAALATASTETGGSRGRVVCGHRSSKSCDPRSASVAWPPGFWTLHVVLARSTATPAAWPLSMPGHPSRSICRRSGSPRRAPLPDSRSLSGKEMPGPNPKEN
jgi:hypothetical protein